MTDTNAPQPEYGYQCRVDGKDFNTRDGCHWHVDHEHPQWSYEVCRPITGITCEECSTEFTSIDEAKEHATAVHGRADAPTEKLAIQTAD